MAPDHMAILTLDDASERQKRIDERGRLDVPDTFESRDEAFQQRVNAAYVELARDYDIATLSVLDETGAKTRETIQAQIRALFD